MLVALPYELQNKQQPLDNNQELLLKSEALDLVLIENATQLFMNWVLGPKNLENILLCITKNMENVHPFPSETFITENLDDQVKSYLKQDPFTLYDSDKIKKFIAIYAIDLKDDGGHYNAFIYDKTTKKLLIFDPMGESIYWDTFETIGMKIFKEAVNIKRADFCPQPTGGFHQNIPKEADDYKMTDEEKELFSIQHVNSQDHFCMMWSIWFIHIFLAEQNYIELLNSVTEDGLKALVTIKIYIVKLMKLCSDNNVNIVTKNLLNNKFWNAHFLSIWSNHESNGFKIFKRYDIKYANNNEPIYNIKYKLNETNSYYREYGEYEKFAREYNINLIINDILKQKYPDKTDFSEYINMNPLKLLTRLNKKDKFIPKAHDGALEIHNNIMGTYNKIVESYVRGQQNNFKNIEELTYFYKYFTGKTLNNLSDLHNGIKDIIDNLTNVEHCTINNKSKITFSDSIICVKNIDDILKKTKNDKIADYQKGVLKHMLKHPGLLVMHGTGTGKTLSAILTIGCLQKMFPLSIIYFITTSSVVEQAKNEFNSYLGEALVSNRIIIKSHQQFTNNVDKLKCNNSIMVIDEAHIFRTEIKRDKNKSITKGLDSYKLLECTKKACKVILLTATPIVNEPYDIENLLAMISHRDPITKKDFYKLSDQAKIERIKCNISYYFKQENDPNYPKKEETMIKVKSSPKTYNNYKILQNKEGRVPLPDSLKWGKPENVAMSGYSKLVNIEDNSKLEKAVELIIKNPGKTLLFTRLASRVNFIKDFLKRKLPPKKNDRKWEIDIISGEVTSKNRSKIQKKYNDDELDIMIITEAAAEGLDLKRTSNIIFLDPVWNQAVEDQIIGRGIRKESHKGIKDPVVKVFKLLLVAPEGEKNTLVDEYMYNIIGEKTTNINKMIELIINNSIEKHSCQH